MTNLDRIRTESPKELAERLANMIDCYVCPMRTKYTDCANDCKETILAWLYEEESEGDCIEQ